MIRIAKHTDPKKLAELKNKINDKDYLAFAIHKIAQILTNEIVHEDDDKNGRRIG